MLSLAFFQRNFSFLYVLKEAENKYIHFSQHQQKIQMYLQLGIYIYISLIQKTTIIECISLLKLVSLLFIGFNLFFVTISYTQKKKLNQNFKGSFFFKIKCAIEYIFDEKPRNKAHHFVNSCYW